MTKMDKGIKTSDLGVGYGNEILIRDICLHVEPGKIMTLIGPNGSGKSTILKTLTRQLKMLGGNVFLAGKNMASLTDAQVSKELSMVMTEGLRTEWMSCRDVVATGRYPYTGPLGILSDVDKEKVEDAIKLVHAGDVADRNFMEISDGQRQRIMLARALCQETDIMVLDEPTSFLDLRYKLDLLSIIRQMTKERHIAVIMSLHELDLAQKISDTVVCVKGDRIGLAGTPEEVFSGENIQKLYDIKAGNYDPVLGISQMEPSCGKPEIFVIGGGGAGIPVYYSLQRRGIPFAAGILSANDREYSVAKALATEVVETAAFEPITEEEIAKAKALIDKCESCICTLESFGTLNAACRELRDYGKGKSTHVVQRGIHGKSYNDPGDDVQRR